MPRKSILCLLFAIFALPLCAVAQISPDEIVAFKSTPQRELELHIFYPNDQREGDGRAAVISFFGGGWVSGSPVQFYSQSEYLASLGAVAIAADYRVIGKDGTTPFEAVMDAKSAVRWVREHCAELGVDPNKIVTAGGSAGGHLAASTALIEGCEDDRDCSTSSQPNAMILFNPVVNTTSEGYGADQLVGHQRELSPVHHVRADLPPTLIMHGTQDSTVPYQNAVEFTERMKECGNQCTLVSAFGENHGFFNGTYRPTFGLRNYNRCMALSAQFLSDLGFIEGYTPCEVEPIRVACLGNSITFGSRLSNPDEQSYPARLQELLGEDYDVRNFGRSGANVLNEGNLPYVTLSQYKEFMSYDPDVVIIKLGTNDSKAKNWQYKDRFEADLTALLDSVKGSSDRSPQIFVCSPVPAFTPEDAIEINSKIIAQEIYPAVKRVAKSSRVTFIDLFEPFIDVKELFPDDIHPNAQGAERLARVIYNYIAQEDMPLQ